MLLHYETLVKRSEMWWFVTLREAAPCSKEAMVFSDMSLLKIIYFVYLWWLSGGRAHICGGKRTTCMKLVLSSHHEGPRE